MTTDAEAIGLPFQEAIRFFRQKASVPTRRWNDIWRGEHSHAFMVAGATSDALLGDFRQAILKALQQGTTLAEFRRDFDQIVEKHGWSYNGSPGWRSRIIYETNLATAYSAGRYAQLTEPGTLAAFPFWQYKHSGSPHPRLQHLAWDGLTLRADDAFWETHYPPNGWRCGCRVIPRSGEDLKRQGKSGPDKAPPVQLREWRDTVTGAVHQVPIGIDPGWDYNPGLAKARGEEPVTSDPMKKLPLDSSPLQPAKSAPLPPIPQPLAEFLEHPLGNVSVGELPRAARTALELPASQLALPSTVATDAHVKPAEWGVLPALIRRPTVGLRHPKGATRLVLLRQSGSVWAAELVGPVVRDFRRVPAAALAGLLDQHDQVYGDADDLGVDTAE